MIHINHIFEKNLLVLRYENDFNGLLSPHLLILRYETDDNGLSSCSTKIHIRDSDISFPQLVGIDLSFNRISDLDAIAHIINNL